MCDINGSVRINCRWILQLDLTPCSTISSSEFYPARHLLVKFNNVFATTDISYCNRIPDAVLRTGWAGCDWTFITASYLLLLPASITICGTTSRFHHNHTCPNHSFPGERHSFPLLNIAFAYWTIISMLPVAVSNNGFWCSIAILNFQLCHELRNFTVIKSARHM